MNSYRQDVADSASLSLKDTLNSFTTEEKLVWDRLSSQPIHIDELAEVCGLPVSDVSIILLQLELKDLVEVMPGQMYKTCF